MVVTFPLPASLTFNMEDIQKSTADNLSRGTLPKIIKINNDYIWQKSDGGNIPTGYVAEIKEIYIKTDDGTKIDLTNNIKEIRVNYGN